MKIVTFIFVTFPQESQVCQVQIQIQFHDDHDHTRGQPMRMNIRVCMQ